MNLRGFIDNARREASSMAAGAFPAIQVIGQGITDDADRLLDPVFGQRKISPNGKFALDDIFRTATNEWVRSTPVLPLLRGNPGEAWDRFYERPISGSLDFIGAGSVANQGLKSLSHLPGPVGSSSLKLRGYTQLDPTSLGSSTNIGQMPSRIKAADGSDLMGREFLLRPDVHRQGKNIWARKTMRSPKTSGSTTFDDAIDIGDTLEDDVLIDQATPRARYEPFAQVGDMLNFGNKIGSKRFGRRLAIRNRTRLKMSTQEMLAEFGRTRKGYRKTFGDDADEAVGRAEFLASGGLMSRADATEALRRVKTPSGRKAVLGENGVDLDTTDGNVVDLHEHELKIAENYIRDRDLFADNLAKNVQAQMDKGNIVVMTGGAKDLELNPAVIKAMKKDIFDLAPRANLHIRRRDHTIEPEAPLQQGQLFGDAPYEGPSQHPLDALKNQPRSPVPKVGETDFELVEAGRSRLFKDEFAGDVGDIPEEEAIALAEHYAMFPKDDGSGVPSGQSITMQMLHPKTGESVGSATYSIIPGAAGRPEMTHKWGSVGGSQGPFYHPYTKDGDYIYVESVNVDPSHQGQGAGRSFYKHLQEQGLPVFRSFVNKELAEKQKKYRSDFDNALDEMFPENKGDVYRNENRARIDEINFNNNQKGLFPTGEMFDQGFSPQKPDTESPQPGLPGTDPRDGTIDIKAEDGELKALRAATSEDYSRAAWHKNYLDNLVKARVDPDSRDLSHLLEDIVNNDKTFEVLESTDFQEKILPSHKALVAAQLEADKVRLGANALSQQNVVRNSDRLAMLFGKDGQGIFHVARPKRGQTKAVDRTKGESPLEIIDENNPGDPSELIAKGELDTNPKVHISNYLGRKREAANQELVDTVESSGVLVDPLEAKVHIQNGNAMTEDDFLKAGTKKAPHVIIRPNGELYKRIEQSQPLAHQAARRLAEEGYHSEAGKIVQAAEDMFKQADDGEFSLGDMIRNPKLRGELPDSRYMVPYDMYRAIVDEVTDSTNALSSFLQMISTGFKICVLHGRWPAWVVNNTIGSQIYLAMTGGLGSTIPHVGGARLATEFFPDVLGAGSREMATGAEDLGRVATSRLDKLLDSKPGRVASDAIATLGDWNQKIADEPARIVRIQQVIEDRFQNTQELAKARGLEIPDTLESRRRMLLDQKIREDIAREVLDDLIDFTTLSKSERMWWSNIIPFWTFIKGSTKSTNRLMADHPGRAWLPAQTAAFGAERTDEDFPAGSPEYMRALMPVGDDEALAVGGFNPYGMQASMFGLLAGSLNSQPPTGQEHPFSMLNPAITVPWASIQNRDTYTGYPLTGNLFKNLGQGTLENVPLIENARNVIAPPEINGRQAFIPSRRNAILNMAGVPIREVDRGNLSSRMQADENRRRDGGVVDYWRFHNGV